MKTVEVEFPSSRALQVQSRFEQWRKSRSRRGPIPEKLWEAAVELTELHSVYKVAKLLRLDYSYLKKRAKNGSLAVTVPGESTGVSFFELPPISENHTESCLIELKRPDGTEMQIRLSSAPAADLSGLIKAFIH